MLLIGKKRDSINQVKMIKGKVRIGSATFFIKWTIVAAKIAAITAPANAIIHLEVPVKNNISAMPVNTELYPYKPELTLFSFAPPNFSDYCTDNGRQKSNNP